MVTLKGGRSNEPRENGKKKIKANLLWRRKIQEVKVKAFRGNNKDPNLEEKKYVTRSRN